MNFNNLIVERKNNIAIVKVNRPDKLNALNHETLIEMKELFELLKNDDSVYIIIITGIGDRAFVAGADIKELNELNSETAKAFAEFGQSVFSLIENLGKPVIAAVNGFALGGGCELALACHIRLGSKNAKFGQPEVNLGIIPGYGGTQRLAKLINTGRALEYILSGNIFDADEAFRLGLLNRVYPCETLTDEAIQLAQTIASKGQIAISAALDATLKSRDLSVTDGLRYESELFAECCGSDDFKEGTAAFLEKRKPNFKNK